MDLRMGGDEFFKKASDAKLPVVDASPQRGEGTVPYIIKNVAGVRVGIVSFGAPALDMGRDQYELRKSMYGAYKEARDNSDVLILLDQANMATDEWLSRNGPRLGAPDIVIGGIARVGISGVQNVGKTCVVPTFMMGKTIGAIDLEVTRGEPLKLTARRIEMDASVPEDQAVAKRVNDALSALTGQPGSVVSAGNPAGDGGPVTTVKSVSSQISAYYPPLLCKNCHEAEYVDWEASKHAAAIKTLLDANRAVPECLTCHSEMFRRAQRVVMPRDGIGGVECATCHYDVLPHGVERSAVKSTVSVDRSLCLACHTTDRSPKYDENTYFQMVSHKSVHSPGTAGTAASAAVTTAP